MPLTRKTRFSGSSIVVTIPSQLVEAFDINQGDLVEIIPYKNGEIRIKKLDNVNHVGGINE
jgi:bifunctional DNA-binding transcriptional regulator/antitoxin component of YhaV-PrlF toxin-antitoxin module